MASRPSMECKKDKRWEASGILTIVEKTSKNANPVCKLHTTWAASTQKSKIRIITGELWDPLAWVDSQYA